jgi:hypothetical protein
MRPTCGRISILPMTRMLGALLLVALGPVGCTKPDRPAEPRESPAVAAAPPLRTDRIAYELTPTDHGWQTQMQLALRNEASDTLYAINCNGAATIALEARSADPAILDTGADGWSVVLPPMTNGCLSQPLVIPPGATFTLPWILGGARPGTNAGPAFPDTAFAGPHRLVWWNLVFHYDPTRRELGDSVPLRYRLSNEFTLRVKP